MPRQPSLADAFRRFEEAEGARVEAGSALIEAGQVIAEEILAHLAAGDSIEIPLARPGSAIIYRCAIVGWPELDQLAPDDQPTEAERRALLRGGAILATMSDRQFQAEGIKTTFGVACHLATPEEWAHFVAEARQVIDLFRVRFQEQQHDWRSATDKAKRHVLSA